VVEKYKSQRLATEGHRERRINYCKFCQITVWNENKSMLLRYHNSNRHKSSSEKLHDICTSTVCDLSDAQTW